MDYCADEAVTVPDVFVTGTGRCGSTLVSALLSEPQEFLTASLRIGVFDSEFLYLQRPDRLGRLACVERSAGSVSVAGLLAARFPAAKFIHIARDGRDCAVSMSRHPNFRLPTCTRSCDGNSGTTLSRPGPPALPGMTCRPPRSRLEEACQPGSAALGWLLDPA